MCGIAGFFGDMAHAPDAACRLQQMTATLAHRGPDGRSQWLGPDVGLGHTRLAIIDLAGGGQPMWSADAMHVIVFNGEIYNYRELKKELETLGYVFKSRSDTEVIWAAIEAWGIELGLRRLRGMFAFALYDVRARKLLLARDRVGIKPLYYARVGEDFIFGSEQKALLAAGRIERKINPVAIHDYLAQGYPTTPATCWSGIELMMPGTWIEVDARGSRSGRYWEWAPLEELNGDIKQATERARGTFVDALRYHLIADVPIGTFLSGGLDSSLIVALLTREEGAAPRTFSMGFGDPAFDETTHARSVADYCGSRHSEMRMESNDGDPDLFGRILAQYDEPFGDSSCIPVFLMCREMRKHVSVVLSGDGGDEVFGGYVRYLNARRISMMAKMGRLLGLLSPAMNFAEVRLGRAGYRVSKAWRLARMPMIERLCSLQCYFTEDERNAMYRPEFARLATAMGPTAERFGSFIPEHVSDPVQQLITAEIRLRLHADYLRKVDIASSAHGLEVRVPFLDNAMLELAAMLPVRYKLASNGATKILSRRLVKELLPPGIAKRPKQGFELPLDRWAGTSMRDFLRSSLIEPQARITSFLDRNSIQQVWHSFENSDSAGGLSRYQRYQRVFMLTSLELWLQHWQPSQA